MTLGEKVIAFIEKYCVIPEGMHVGKPVRLDSFQKKFIIDIFDNPHITDTAILSIARKNAKTGLIAFIVIAFLVGPVAEANARIISGAMSRDQAAEVFNLASKCVRLSKVLNKIIVIVPSKKILKGLPMGTEYQAISADAKTAHGKSPKVAILDEVGQISGPQSDFVDAITTAQGAHAHPLLIYISTQAASDGDFFSIQIDDAKEHKPPKTVCHIYAADQDAEIMDEKAWKDANPALGSFRSEADMRKQAEKAARMPSFENTFRNLNLNQRVSRSNPFISRDTWKACNAEPVPIEHCEKIYGGLDLSSKKDLTAFVLYGLHEDVWYAYPYFWTPERGLIDRSKSDRAPYDVWVRQGYLETSPSATIDYEFVAMRIADICSDIELDGIAFDRWRMEFLQKELERIGVDLPLTPWGQGFKDMSPALEALESTVLNENLGHGDHPVLTMCAANAVVEKNPAGDRKLNKMNPHKKIDGLQALAMAAGLAQRASEKETSIDEFIYDPIVIN